MLGSKTLEMIAVTEPVRIAAWARFKKTRVPPASLTDCTSFEIMDDLKMREAFTFDEDFRQAGYRVLP